MTERCCDGLLEDHDGRPGQCTRALLAICERAEERVRLKAEEDASEIDRRQRDRHDH